MDLRVRPPRHTRRRRCRLPPAGNSDSAPDLSCCGGRIGVRLAERRHAQSVAGGVHAPRPAARSHRSEAAGTFGTCRRLEITVASVRACGVRRGRSSRRVDVNRANGTRRDAGAPRVTNASPEWAAHLRVAQARANARRRMAGSDAAVTRWVRALMRDRRDRENASGPADASAPEAPRLFAVSEEARGGEWSHRSRADSATRASVGERGRAAPVRDHRCRHGRCCRSA